jgi:hypothetical protein
MQSTGCRQRLPGWKNRNRSKDRATETNFEIVATNTLTDHMFVAAPAVAEGEMFLRSKTHLLCVSEGKTE